MALSLATIIIIPIIIFSPIFNVGNIFGENKKAGGHGGAVLGVSENFNDNFEQVLITSQDKEDLEINIINEEKKYAPQIYDYEVVSILPENKEKSGPFPMDDFQELVTTSKINCAIDATSNKIIYNKNNNQTAPIASITKLMTALVFLEHNPGWDSIYVIQRDDRREGGKIYLYLGEQVTVKDLFYLSLVGSANTATAALVHSAGFTEEEFADKMNAKAVALGLLKTNFEDATGLSNQNISTAFEVAQIAKHALAEKEISEATLKRQYVFKTLAGVEKRVYSTDYLLENFPQNGIKILGGKTGYTDLAGYCFVGKFVNKNGNEIITVVLGGDDKNSRFHETRELAEWAYDNYTWN